MILPNSQNFSLDIANLFPFFERSKTFCPYCSLHKRGPVYPWSQESQINSLLLSVLQSRLTVRLLSKASHPDVLDSLLSGQLHTSPVHHTLLWFKRKCEEELRLPYLRNLISSQNLQTTLKKQIVSLWKGRGKRGFFNSWTVTLVIVLVTCPSVLCRYQDLNVLYCCLLYTL